MEKQLAEELYIRFVIDQNPEPLRSVWHFVEIYERDVMNIWCVVRQGMQFYGIEYSTYHGYVATPVKKEMQRVWVDVE
jgi:hypothetical protein